MKRAVLVIGLMALLFVPAAQVKAGVQDFTISNFQADYYLAKDAEGRSTLKTAEHIVTQFPNYDQNHGIERAIPSKYDGHKTSLKIVSVTDGAGAAWNYKTQSEGNLTVLRIGDAKRYVQGEQTYNISYTQRDVTKYFADTNDDEFYWDTNGTGWLQPIQQLTATVHVEKSLTPNLTGKYSCYQGALGATETCSITRKDAADGAVDFVATATRLLEPTENVTFAIGFEPHTFAEYAPTFAEKAMIILTIVFFFSLLLTLPIAIGLIIWFFVRQSRSKFRASEVGSIAPEYLPPKEVGVMVAAKVCKETKGDPKAAQLIDLAVRHYLKIYQTSEKGLLHGAEYEIELAKPPVDLRPEELTFVKTLFGDKSRISLKELKKDTMKQTDFVQDDANLTKQLTSSPYELYEQDAQQRHWFRRAALIIAVLSVPLLSPLLLLAAGIAFLLSFSSQRLTDKGLQLERYLYGLRDYIKLAEADRLRMLQSPEGAEKVGFGIGADKPGELVKLYERVLPYAILFGEEKGWNELLGKYYEQANVQPNWYVGQSAFNAAVFSSAMSSFSSSASTSSSSGGSGGGGSSGGGGGGGGGGGW